MRRREFFTLLGAAPAWTPSPSAMPRPNRCGGSASCRRCLLRRSVRLRSRRFATRFATSAMSRAKTSISSIDGPAATRIGSAVDAAELARLGVDVIFAVPGTPAVIAAKKATATIPIVFVGVGDAVGSGLRGQSSTTRGNATGLVISRWTSPAQAATASQAKPSQPLSARRRAWRPRPIRSQEFLSRFDEVMRRRRQKILGGSYLSSRPVRRTNYESAFADVAQTIRCQLYHRSFVQARFLSSERAQTYRVRQHNTPCPQVYRSCTPIRRQGRPDDLRPTNIPETLSDCQAAVYARQNSQGRRIQRICRFRQSSKF